MSRPQTTSPASPEAFNIWNHKPWWCQPWSILLTGTGLIAGSWLVFHRYWVTGLVAVPMLTWMGYFLLLFPRLAAQAARESSRSPS